MPVRFLKTFGSPRVSVALLAVLFVCVFGGTLAQAAWGAEAVQTTLYSHVVFFWQGLGVPGVPVPGLPFWLGLTGLNLLAGAIVGLPRTWNAAGLWLTHSALVLFCFAGLGFAFAQEELVLGLPVGATADRAFVKNSEAGETKPLPFTLTVEAFSIPTYPGSREPSDYISTVRLRAEGVDQKGEIRMNQPLRFDGYTLYQSSVQTVDGSSAPVFKITRNAWGFLPYAFSLLLVGGLGLHLVLRSRPEGSLA